MHELNKDVQYGFEVNINKYKSILTICLLNRKS